MLADAIGALATLSRSAKPLEVNRLWEWAEPECLDGHDYSARRAIAGPMRTTRMPQPMAANALFGKRDNLAHSLRTHTGLAIRHYGDAVNSNEFLDLTKREAKALADPDEIHSFEILTLVTAVSARCPRRFAQESFVLVEADGLHIHIGWAAISPILMLKPLR